MQDVFIAGTGMISFGRYPDKNIKSLVGEALKDAMEDTNLNFSQIEAAFFANVFWDQVSIKGQVALRPYGIEAIPITNVENACASGSTAFHHAWLAIASGAYDCALAVGVEKLYSDDKEKIFRSFIAGVDVEESAKQFAIWNEMVRNAGLKIPPEFKDSPRTPFMDMYASHCQYHMSKYGTTQKQLAIIAAKNHNFGAMNPRAQYRNKMTVEQVLGDKGVVYPLTRAMCAPIGDGAAAVILASSRIVKKYGTTPVVKILASVLASGRDRSVDDEDVGERAAKKAYEMATLGPDDIDVAEVHDATAFGELHITESMGFCPKGEGGPFAESGATGMGGKVVVNPSGGLISRGHPIAATGLAQIHELVCQLRGESGSRQVENARIALHENGGGTIGYEEAAMGVNILARGK